MAEICIDIKKAMESSQEIISVAEKLKKLKNELDSVKAREILDSQSGQKINQVIIKISEEISNEATKMNSLGDALQVIAHKYQATEKAITSTQIKILESNMSSETSESGTDKRNWLEKFWDWLTNNDPDEYDTTNVSRKKQLMML
ncbi:MAG: hypothetical protein K2L07_09330 [Lachnospiraceae bacterium]|nr:hypothetical protein [Lachnospiraceae bacterium]